MTVRELKQIVDEAMERGHDNAIVEMTHNQAWNQCGKIQNPMAWIAYYASNGQPQKPRLVINADL